MKRKPPTLAHCDDVQVKMFHIRIGYLKRVVAEFHELPNRYLLRKLNRNGYFIFLEPGRYLPVKWFHRSTETCLLTPTKKEILCSVKK